MAPMTFATIYCPCGCGETVGLEMGGFESTGVTVGACSAKLATGIVSYTMRKSAALGFTVAPATA